MADKSFEHSVPFQSGPGHHGVIRQLPIIPVTIFAADGTRHQLPLLFDTGASVTYLRHDLYPLFGVASWNQGGHRVSFGATGSSLEKEGYLYQAVMQVFGKTIDCPIVLTELPADPLFVGLFGRRGVYEHFGFGFWENSLELLATENP